jgi:hypothetical protein
MTMNKEEFREIAHTSGQVIIRVGPDEQGKRGYQQTWRHQRPVESAIFAIYALAQGVPVCGLPLGGMGSPMPPPPIPSCFMVFIGSDSEGKFGHECPACRGYWRDEAGFLNARGLSQLAPRIRDLSPDMDHGSGGGNESGLPDVMACFFLI